MRTDLACRGRQRGSHRGRRQHRSEHRAPSFGPGRSTPTSVVHHRYYDPSTDQFISVDPLVSQTGQPFSYANDNPVNGSDPSGLICWSPSCLGRDVVVGAVAVAIAIGSASHYLTEGGHGVGNNLYSDFNRFAAACGAFPQGGYNSGNGDKQPKSSPNFEAPTNPPQLPPSSIPEGWRIRPMPSTNDYPNGYWKLEKPMANGGWQPIDPSTMRPGTRAETHIPFPPGED